MDNKYLAQLLFPNVTKTIKDYDVIYPKRQLKEGAQVTRIAPSPTGFMHLGNLFGAIADERVAHLSGGVFYLRIEDTDLKRQVEGGAEAVIKAFSEYNLLFDEGVGAEGETGEYGPYCQRKREQIYKTYAKYLVEAGLAYPCFCTAQDLEKLREKQKENKENFGYYGKYAKHRSFKTEEIEKLLNSKIPYVLRFKSMGNADNKIKHNDLIKGLIEMPENDQDIVLLKSDGIPTYHFAHVVDDYLMRTTIVIRGEEWLATLPVHLQLFRALELKPPKYAHTAQLLKMDNGRKRKLSKRKDPELGLSYYRETGYPVAAVTEYLMTLLNSDFEEWRRANPKEDINKFKFSLKKMGTSGALFDIDKLRDISKNVIANMDATEVLDLVCEWAKECDKPFYELLAKDKEYALRIFEIGRGGKKPRKDIASFSEVKDYMGFFYDELFTAEYEFLDNISNLVSAEILNEYLISYKHENEMSIWFEDMCKAGEKHGFAPTTAQYKENPDKYLGAPKDVSQVVRVAVTGRQNSPDLFAVIQIIGEDRLKDRLKKAIGILKDRS